MRSHIALLRGVNVGGKGKAPMSDLRALLADLRLEEGLTLLQSGNLAFKTEGKSREVLEDLLKEEASKRLGLETEFFVRTAADLEVLIAANPFPQEALADPSHLLVVFLKNPADPIELEQLQAAVKGRETIRACHDHLFVVFPDGIGDSKLLTMPGWKRLGGHGTGRNWNTVLKLSAALRS